MCSRSAAARPHAGLVARFIVSVIGLALMLSACASFPKDPEGTLQEVTNGTLVVGATESGRRVHFEPGQEPSGIEPELVREFAESLDAKIEWVHGAESELVERLEQGELHLVIGGIERSTPWANEVSATQPYATTVDAHGNEVEHVLLAPQGENAFLLALDSFVLEQR